jgi:hypothetical protein
MPSKNVYLSSSSRSALPYDLMNIIRRVGHEVVTGRLDIGDANAVVALARQIEPDLAPRIVPDKLYRIPELKRRFGYTHSAIYGRRRHLIRKDRGRSVILGRDLLVDQDAMPHLVAPPEAAGTDAAVAARRPRGRPRKHIS